MFGIHEDHQCHTGSSRFTMLRRTGIHWLAAHLGKPDLFSVLPQSCWKDRLTVRANNDTCPLTRSETLRDTYEYIVHAADGADKGKGSLAARVRVERSELLHVWLDCDAIWRLPLSMAYRVSDSDCALCSVRRDI